MPVENKQGKYLPIIKNAKLDSRNYYQYNFIVMSGVISSSCYLYFAINVLVADVI